MNILDIDDKTKFHYLRLVRSESGKVKLFFWKL